jgi:hypothetical protein
MDDERSVKIQEIEDCIGCVGEEKHENLLMQPEVIGFAVVLVKIKGTYEEFHPTFIATRRTVSSREIE